jgi:signal transduction histidine kinase
VRVSCHVAGEPFPLDQQAIHELMMVAREGFFNAVLHGHPKEISSQLTFAPETFQMILSDDGKGFDPASSAASGHYGLQGMRERVRKFSGSLEIESAPNRGTLLRVTIPRSALSRRSSSQIASI